MLYSCHFQKQPIYIYNTYTTSQSSTRQTLYKYCKILDLRGFQHETFFLPNVISSFQWFHMAAICRMGKIRPLFDSSYFFSYIFIEDNVRIQVGSNECEYSCENVFLKMQCSQTLQAAWRKCLAKFLRKKKLKTLSQYSRTL